MCITVWSYEMFLWEVYSITRSGELRLWVSLNLPETLVGAETRNQVSWFVTRYPFSSLCTKRMRSKTSGKLWQSRFSWSEPSTEDKGCHSDHSSISFYVNMAPLCLPWLCLGKLFHISPSFQWLHCGGIDVSGFFTMLTEAQPTPKRRA